MSDRTTTDVTCATPESPSMFAKVGDCTAGAIHRFEGYGAPGGGAALGELDFAVYSCERHRTGASAWLPEGLHATQVPYRDRGIDFSRQCGVTVDYRVLDKRP